MNNYIKITQCADCKSCCFNIPESICSFNAIEEILNGGITESYVKQMVVYHVAEKDIDRMGKQWLMFPSVNYLRYMTGPEKGFYEFLALPAVKDNCILLTDKGCLYPAAKPFECGMYPFYMYKLQFRTDYECDYAKELEDDIHVSEFVSQYMADHLIYCEKNKQNYFEAVKDLKNKYQLRAINA